MHRITTQLEVVIGLCSQSTEAAGGFKTALRSRPARPRTGTSRDRCSTPSQFARAEGCPQRCPQFHAHPTIVGSQPIDFGVIVIAVLTGGHLLPKQMLSHRDRSRRSPCRPATERDAMRRPKSAPSQRTELPTFDCPPFILIGPRRFHRILNSPSYRLRFSRR
jgi:hypothetical protein